MNAILKTSTSVKLPQENDPKTILVVDDCPELCEVAAEFLRRSGYSVLMANHGEQAIRVARAHPEIDLLLTDVEMPVMMGDELSAWFHVARPETAVVYMSGNPLQKARLGPCHFVEKPFLHLDDLLQAIQAAISSPERRS